MRSGIENEKKPKRIHGPESADKMCRVGGRQEISAAALHVVPISL